MISKLRLTFRLFRITVALAVFASLCMGGAIPTSQASQFMSPAVTCIPGPHSGEIAADQTWCAADNPHIIDGLITVDAGVILTLQPGVQVQTGDYIEWDIYGNLDAQGTNESPISFSSQTTQWSGMAFQGTGASGHLSHVTVANAGGYNVLGNSFSEITINSVNPGPVLIEDSLVTNATSGNSGHTYGITVVDSQFTMTGTTISGMGCCSDDSAIKISGSQTVATLNQNIFTGNPGTTLSVTSVANATISHNEFYGNWLAMTINGNNILVDHNLVHDNGGGTDPEGGLAVNGGSPTISGNIIRHNQVHTGAISINNSSPLLVNNVIIDNYPTSDACPAIALMNANAVFKYTTIANNNGDAICVYGDNIQGQFYNTLIANHPVGVFTTLSGGVEMHHTLWDNVPILLSGPGSLNNDTPVFGKSELDLDEYHLTRQSMAIGMGVDVGVSIDIDGNVRPSPAGTLPDIGAVEFTEPQGPSFWIDFYDEGPQFVAAANGGAQIQQDFYIFWYYGSDQTSPPELPMTMTDTLGTGMQYLSEDISGSGNFNLTQQGQTLTWQAQQPVQKNQFGFIHYKIAYDSSAQPGQQVDNTVHIIAGPNTYDQKITTEIPFFTPKITWPTDGETCAGDLSLIKVMGYAIPGSYIKLFEDGSEIAMGSADNTGLFVIIYSSAKAGIDDYTQVYVESCSVLNPFDCSKPSNIVTMSKQTSFWCPKQSYWDGTYETIHGGTETHFARFGFRDSTGKLATENWAFAAGTGLTSSTLSLHLCICPNSIDYPTSAWVVVNGTRYDPSGGSQHIPSFSIPTASGPVEFHGMCGGLEMVNHGTILVDPDGFIFDVTKGFDESDPAKQFVLPGVTVTLMVDEPVLGGWVPWPAQLYDSQINPQVTGTDGYYAFYTPPGRYFVMVSGEAGFQAWHSPVITVTNQLVHMNVPLTPISTQNIHKVNLSVTGIDQPLINVQPGDTVEWDAEIVPNISTQTRQVYTADPVIRVLSTLDPLSNVLGWDSGMLAPGFVYQRQFTQKGDFLYQDGLGHSGEVLVGTTMIYLPLTIKK
jgi:hypothetical protein